MVLAFDMSYVTYVFAAKEPQTSHLPLLRKAPPPLAAGQRLGTYPSVGFTCYRFRKQFFKDKRKRIDRGQRFKNPTKTFTCGQCHYPAGADIGTEL